MMLLGMVVNGWMSLDTRLVVRESELVLVSSVYDGDGLPKNRWILVWRLRFDIFLNGWVDRIFYQAESFLDIY